MPSKDVKALKTKVKVGGNLKGTSPDTDSRSSPSFALRSFRNLTLSSWNSSSSSSSRGGGGYTFVVGSRQPKTKRQTSLDGTSCPDTKQHTVCRPREKSSPLPLVRVHTTTCFLGVVGARRAYSAHSPTRCTRRLSRAEVLNRMRKTAARTTTYKVWSNVGGEQSRLNKANTTEGK